MFLSLFLSALPPYRESGGGILAQHRGEVSKEVESPPQPSPSFICSVLSSSGVHHSSNAWPPTGTHIPSLITGRYPSCSKGLELISQVSQSSCWVITLREPGPGQSEASGQRPPE